MVDNNSLARVGRLRPWGQGLVCDDDPVRLDLAHYLRPRRQDSRRGPIVRGRADVAEIDGEVGSVRVASGPVRLARDLLHVLRRYETVRAVLVAPDVRRIEP